MFFFFYTIFRLQFPLPIYLSVWDSIFGWLAWLAIESTLSRSGLELQTHTSTVSFSVGAGNLNSGSLHSRAVTNRAICQPLHPISFLLYLVYWWESSPCLSLIRWVFISNFPFVFLFRTISFLTEFLIHVVGLLVQILTHFFTSFLSLNCFSCIPVTSVSSDLVIE